MKKLMFAVAALAAGVACAEITSQNIVGYQTKTVGAGFSLNTPTFVAVAGEGYDIQDFKLGADADGSGAESIQVLNTSGVNNESWVWLNENVGMDPGWYDMNTWEAVAYTIKPGEGFLMSVDADVSMTAAGQVGGETTVTLPAGFSVIGNNSPVEIKIQDIKLSASADGSGGESIQVLDVNGVNNESWVWLNENVGMDPGWYDINTWEPIEYAVSAGESFLITVDAEVSVTIPSAL